MFCVKCGEAIPDGSEVCPKCGANPRETEPAVVYASQGSDPAPKKMNKKTALIIGICACVVAVFLIVSSTGKASLKKALEKDWYALDGSLIQVLDIDDDEIVYRLETGYSWLDTTVATYDWKPISRNKIKVNRVSGVDETFTIEMNDDKTIFTVTPALTSLDDSETWYHLD